MKPVLNGNLYMSRPDVSGYLDLIVIVDAKYGYTVKHHSGNDGEYGKMTGSTGYEWLYHNFIEVTPTLAPFFIRII